MDKLATNESSVDPKAGDDSIATTDSGVWRLLIPKGARKRAMLVDGGFLRDKWSEALAISPLMIRFLREIYQAGPMLLVLSALCKAWSGIQPTLLLYASSRLLLVVRNLKISSLLSLTHLHWRQIEVGLKEGHPDVYAICQAVLTRVICVVLDRTVCWAGSVSNDNLLSRAVHFW